MDSNGSIHTLPEQEMTSLEFHLALLNKVHTIQPDGEIMEACMWLIPFITGPGHLWWSIYPSDNQGVELSSSSDEWVFTFEFHKDHGFVKLTADCIHLAEPEFQNHATIDFIDMDKVPQESLGMSEIIELHHKFSEEWMKTDPDWKQHMIAGSMPTKA